MSITERMCNFIALFQKGEFMTIDPTNNVTGNPKVTQGKQTNKNAALMPPSVKALFQLAKSAQAGALNNLPETPGAKTGGVVFAKGTLKNLEIKEDRIKDGDGTFIPRIRYVATLTDGTVVEYPEQEPLEGKNGELTPPTIKRNKDGSIDFNGLRNAQITDTTQNDKYNIMGCSHTSVSADRGKDSDVIDAGSIKLSDGTIKGSERIIIDYNKGDQVADMSASLNFHEVREHDGSIEFTQYYQGMKDIREAYEKNVEHLEYGRKRVTKFSAEKGYSSTVYAHDDVPLKESYVNATEKVLADGYRIKTSPDGKEQWFYTPDGKSISKEEFRNRGL